MDLTPCDLSDFGRSASVSFAQCELSCFRHYQRELPARGAMLIVAFAGRAGNSREEAETFPFMRAMIAAGLAAWEPVALVVDLHALWYEWGDWMGRILGEIELPYAVVASAANRKGLESLYRQELLVDPAEYLFDSLEAAVNAADRKYCSDTERFA